jgi:hypothetical protein
MEIVMTGKVVSSEVKLRGAFEKFVDSSYYSESELVEVL